MPGLFPLPHIEDSPKRVRASFGGKFIVDTTKAKLVWRHIEEPDYHFSTDILPLENLKNKKVTADGATYDLVVGSKSAPAAVTTFETSKDFKGLFTISFKAMDFWFEEDEQIFVGTKDPYKRVEVLQSSRHIRVEINGIEVANTRMARLLYETNLRTRTYIPKTDCRIDLLEPSDLTTQCQYKGVANYYHVREPSGKRHDNIVWWYRSPIPECGTIKGYLAFYDDKVDVWVDGEKQPRKIAGVLEV